MAHEDIMKDLQNVLKEHGSADVAMLIRKKDIDQFANALSTGIQEVSEKNDLTDDEEESLHRILEEHLFPLMDLSNMQLK